MKGKVKCLGVIYESFVHFQVWRNLFRGFEAVAIPPPHHQGH